MFSKLSKKRLANALRFLSVDAIYLANSGHPGMPLGMADIAEVLWNDFFIHNPRNPKWINRDRFILSNGHGSMLQYALLHLSGYQLTIKDLKNFRQLHSNTPGHPEYGLTPGVEATTGPLGQGLGMAVGMALAEKLLASKFNKKDFNIIDHYTYCFVGDGCLMEGISHEVSSIAGTLGLNKLIVFWDNNKVSIDGNTENWFTENVAQRFLGYNWHVIENIDGHDPESITKAIVMAKLESHRPSLLCCNTIIGYGSMAAGSSRAHGKPFSKEEVTFIRKNLSWEEEPFVIPEDIYAAWKAFALKAGAKNIFWERKLSDYKQQYPELFSEFNRRINNVLPEKLDLLIQQLINQTINQLYKGNLAQADGNLDALNYVNNLDNLGNLSTREGSQLFLNIVSKELPELFGGSADLASSDLTLHINAVPFNINHNKFIPFNYLHFGVREFGMFCILNGMSLHQGFIPYGGTFLVFIDYAKSALRLSGLMQNKIIYVLTHDSIGIGEDGPTHQPIEHTSMLRMIPNISVWRPCDTIETIFAWRFAISNARPTCLILTRQKVVEQVRNEYKQIMEQDRDRSIFSLMKIQYGGYILYEVLHGASFPEVIIIATGSEVNLATLSAKKLAIMMIKVRVVSMPSSDVFLQQSKEYREQVLPSNIVNRVVVEAGSTFIWYKFIGTHGKVIGIDRFGCSGKGTDLYKFFDITVDHIVEEVLSLVNA